MICKDKVTRGLWRLRVNGFLITILGTILYAIATTSFWASYHRFVTNPREVDMNGTLAEGNKMEPGLGKSELFYSSIVTALQISSVVGSLLSSFLVKLQVPYWYQCLAYHALHILGYVLYGITTEGWEIFLGIALVGLYVGAQLTLIFSYETKLSIEWVELMKQRGDEFECQKSEEVKIRNFLFALNTLGGTIGTALGTGIAVLFAYLPIEQYRSIAWFNVACGLAVLFLFALFFRGESRWQQAKEYCCCKSWECNTRKGPSPLQIFISSPQSYNSYIIITMHVFCIVEMLKWAYWEVLLSPVLSDSFGLPLDMSSFFYLGMSLPRVIGTVTVILLQKLKVKTQIIAIIGIVMAITGYILVADWQAIPYDPCTEYSPFHHPERFGNISLPTDHLNQSIVLESTSLEKLKMYSNAELEFENHEAISVPLVSLFGQCKEDTTCSICTKRRNLSQPCLTFPIDPTNYQNNPQIYSCSIGVKTSSVLEKTFCVNIYTEQMTSINPSNAKIQKLMVLPKDVYTVVSSACMNTSSEKCHWIPFSTITNETCIDCPPICRSKDQTLTLPQLVIGLFLLIASHTTIWVPTLAMTLNQVSEELQAIVIGTLMAMFAIGQGIGPLIADALYEGAQKRTFSSSILLASLHIPFLVKIIVLFRQLGPKLTKPEYEKLDSKDSVE